MKTILVSFLVVLTWLPLALPAEETAPADEESAASTETTVAASTEEASGTAPERPRTLSGMSVLGNEEAPKSLVIVPWKSSELGDELELTDTLDDRARPVDREVFRRELRYYALRSGE